MRRKDRYTLLAFVTGMTICLVGASPAGVPIRVFNAGWMAGAMVYIAALFLEEADK